MATTFQGLLTEIEHAAAVAVATIRTDVIALETQILPVLEADIAMFLGQLKDLAISTVLEMAGKAISGEEKFGNVVTTVLQSAEAKGIAIVVADAQMLAQQAYYAVAKALHLQTS